MNILSKMLENGLTVFLAPMIGTETITGVFVVKAGTKYQAGISEIAHLLEHMAFKGTQYRSPIDISRAIEGVGGQFNAFTSEEVIFYYIKTPASYTELVCDILADIILNPLLDLIAMEKEKNVLIDELNTTKSDPMANLAGLILRPILFPYSRREEKDIKKITRDHLIEYRHDLFTGPNSAVVFAGKIPDPEWLFSKIGESFKGLPARTPKRQKATIQPEPGPVFVKIIYKGIQQTQLAMGIKCSPATNVKYPLMILNHILGVGESSRLFQELRVKRGFCYDIHSYLDLQSDIGFIIITGAFTQKWQEALEIIKEQFIFLCHDIDKEELESVKEGVLGRIIMNMENSLFVAENIALDWAIEGKVKTFEEEKEHINKVTINDIKIAAQETFKPENIYIALMGPKIKQEKEILKLFSSL